MRFSLICSASEIALKSVAPTVHHPSETQHLSFSSTLSCDNSAELTDRMHFCSTLAFRMTMIRWRPVSGNCTLQHDSFPTPSANINDGARVNVFLPRFWFSRPVLFVHPLKHAYRACWWCHSINTLAHSSLRCLVSSSTPVRSRCLKLSFSFFFSCYFSLSLIRTLAVTHQRL